MICNTMTLQEIKEALHKGYSVHWSNEGYKVVIDDGMPLGFGLLFERNNNYSPLSHSDLSHCFIIKP